MELSGNDAKDSVIDLIMPSSEFNGPDTPVAVSKRKNNALAAKASDKKSSSAPAHPLRLVNARDNRRQSRQSLSSETDDDSAAVEYSTSQPASPGVDFLAKMSSALASVRTLKRDLAERDATLTQVRAEKEKYEEEHGKIYSQMASLRSRLHVFENQLAKKTQEFVTLQSQFDEAQREITKLRATQADDTSKQTIRIKALEAQVVHWKKQAESAPKPSQNENDSPLVVENAELREMVRALRERVTIYEEEAVDRKDLLAKFELLNERLEETRVSMLRLSTEKTLLQQENQKLKTLVKDLDQVEELKSRLSVLEVNTQNISIQLFILL